MSRKVFTMFCHLINKNLLASWKSYCHSRLWTPCGGIFFNKYFVKKTVLTKRILVLILCILCLLILSHLKSLCKWLPQRSFRIVVESQCIAHANFSLITSVQESIKLIEWLCRHIFLPIRNAGAKNHPPNPYQSTSGQRNFHHPTNRQPRPRSNVVNTCQQLQTRALCFHILCLCIL